VVLVDLRTFEWIVVSQRPVVVDKGVHSAKHVMYHLVGLPLLHSLISSSLISWEIRMIPPPRIVCWCIWIISLSLVSSIQLLFLTAHKWAWKERAIFHDMSRGLTVKATQNRCLIYVIELWRSPLAFQHFNPPHKCCHLCFGCNRVFNRVHVTLCVVVEEVVFGGFALNPSHCMIFYAISSRNIHASSVILMKSPWLMNSRRVFKL